MISKNVNKQMKTKNLKKVLLLVTITILLVGLVSAATTNKTSTTKNTKIVKDPGKTIVKTATKTIKEPNKKVMKKSVTKKIITINNNQKKKLANLYTTTALNYTDLKNKIDKAKNTKYNEFNINLKKSSTYKATQSLTWGDSKNTKKLTINGNGATINGQNKYHFMNVKKGYTLILNNVVITNFKTKSNNGGAIVNEGNLTITHRH